MDSTTRKRFKELLLDIAQWREESWRSGIIDDALWEHPLLDHLDKRGTPSEVADRLIRLCSDYSGAPNSDGLAPALAILVTLKQKGIAGGPRADKVAELESALRMKTVSTASGTGVASPRPPDDGSSQWPDTGAWPAPSFVARVRSAYGKDGTGILIASDRVLTARHVVAHDTDGDERSECQPGGELFPPDVLSIDVGGTCGLHVNDITDYPGEDLDLAVLHLGKAVADHRVCRFVEGATRRYDSHIKAAPFSSFGFGKLKGDAGAPHESPGIRISRTEYAPLGLTRLELRGSDRDGFSGAPLCLPGPRDGEWLVIALLTMGGTNTLAHPTDLVLPFLREHGLAHESLHAHEVFPGTRSPPSRATKPGDRNSEPVPEATPSDDASERAYLEALLAKINSDALRYSPLNFRAEAIRSTAQDPDPLGFDQMLELQPLRWERRARGPDELQRIEGTQDLDNVLDAFAKVNRAVVLGEPGGGKTTTLSKLTFELARQRLDWLDKRHDTTSPQSDPPPLPLFARLSEWQASGQTVDDYLAKQFNAVLGDLAGHLDRDHCVLLLDGLNEIPTGQWNKKGALLKAYLEESLAPRHGAYISCRQDDYTATLDLGLDTLTLLRLNPMQVRAVLVHWFTVRAVDDEAHAQGRQDALRFFWTLAGDERLAGVLKKWLEAGATEGDFWREKEAPCWNFGDVWSRIRWEGRDLWSRHVGDPRSLIRLAENPWMLTMLFVVRDQDGGVLPSNRGRLFQRFTESLLTREHSRKGEAPSITDEDRQLLNVLADLAWDMQTSPLATDTEANDEQGARYVIARARAVDLLGNEARLAQALNATFVEGSSEIRFRHQLLQEYFAARCIDQRVSQRTLEATDLWPSDHWWQRTGWEEAAVLYAGLHPKDCSGVVRWLAHAQPEVAARCLLESGSEIGGRAGLLNELRAAWLPRLTDTTGEPDFRARAAVGRALGVLGIDNRKGVGLRADGLPDILWRAVPGGEVTIKNHGPRPVAPFYLAAYPVTHAQFQAFIDLGGYDDERCWERLYRRYDAPADAHWTESNHPHVDVSWYEAMAFCTWLSARLGYEVRLPTEAEWQWAAQAARAENVFPWGEEEYETHRANAGLSRFGRTSPVGIDPEAVAFGAVEASSPVRAIHDLSGNVSQWCLNAYDDPDHIIPGGDKIRALRGLSGILNPGMARTGGRGLYPFIRYGRLGFRVVCSSPIALNTDSPDSDL
ncbi:MAG: SUMF1/EgtB/PvdO family nonheme iron enzyme [Gammaproteobacteria bacterium]